MDINLNQHLVDLIENKKLIEAVFSRPLSATVRPIQLKTGFFYQFTRNVDNKALHTNYTGAELLRLIENEFISQAKEITFYGHEFDLLVIKGRMLKKKASKAATVLQHNRIKHTVLQEGEPLPFLVELGLMKQNGSLIAAKADKFKQINKYLELIQTITPHLPQDRPVQIVDFGCGKGYLTFALYHYLHTIQGKDVRVHGLDLKAEVMADCENLARRLGYDGLHFSVGAIQEYSQESVDMVIALHACNTATDAALAKGVAWGARVILAAPCCQHELLKQVHSEPLDSLLRHGILREKFAALVTDAIRADLLEVCGYTTQVVEFVDAEHTPKNLLIRAVKGISNVQQKKALARYLKFKSALQITPTLQHILAQFQDFPACEGINGND